MTALSLDIESLRAGYAADLSPKAVIEAVYARIAQVNDPGIFIHLRDKADVLAEAEALGDFDPSRPLWGIPFGVKDNIDLADVPTTAACPAFEYTADTDAHVVAQLRAAGALAIGKTNLDQFATGLVGVRSPYPIPRNAIDPEIVPGGSSSGSAVAVAQGIVSFALGTDTAGSGRVPAALNNIVGLKPSLGALSASGMVPACRTLDTISIFALTVGDAYTAFGVAADYDAADAYARPITVPALSAPPPKLTIGVPDAASIEFFGDTVQAASFAATLEALKTQGATLKPIDFTPLYEVAKMLYEGAWVAERMSAIEDLMHNSPDDVHPVTRTIVSAADGLSAVDAFRGIYRLADLRRAAEQALSQVDCLCVPTMPTFYSVADLQADPITPNSRFGTYTNFVNLMDMCGIAVPTAPRSDGRPGSVTLLAPWGQDGLVAGLAAQLHGALAPAPGAADLVPCAATPLHPATLAEDEMAIAVVGAHMSGLPLNGELTTRGARFLQQAQSSANYRLYALAGGPPVRPGMIRDEDAGAAIALEVWAMPKSSWGAFIQGIPSPLCIGSVELSDGSMVKGFLVEPTPLATATEVTSFGGWRAYLQSKAA